MARTEEKVRELVENDGQMRQALETVLERADNGEVAWVDVKGDIESGQWGRLIEKEVLVEGEAGFRLADAEATREVLHGDGAAETGSAAATDAGGETEDVDTTEWSTWDKLAGLATLGFFVGYSYAPVRNLVGNAVNVLLGPLLDTMPFYAVVMVIAVFTGLYSTILRALLMDMEKMSAYQERMSDIQERRKAAKERGDDDALDRIQEEQMEAMGDQLGMFKEQFRPMVWIMFLTIPAFLWMYWAIGLRGAGGGPFELANIVLPLIGSVTWTQSILGPIQTWIVWYFLCSMAFTQIIQKALNIEMTPGT